MPGCFRCGRVVRVMSPRDLFGLVPVENHGHVLDALALIGRAAVAFVCPWCRWCGFTTDPAYSVN